MTHTYTLLSVSAYFHLLLALSLSLCPYPSFTLFLLVFIVRLSTLVVMTANGSGSGAMCFERTRRIWQEHGDSEEENYVFPGKRDRQGGREGGREERCSQTEKRKIDKNEGITRWKDMVRRTGMESWNQ